MVVHLLVYLGSCTLLFCLSVALYIHLYRQESNLVTDIAKYLTKGDIGNIDVIEGMVCLLFIMFGLILGLSATLLLMKTIEYFHMKYRVPVILTVLSVVSMIEFLIMEIHRICRFFLKLTGKEWRIILCAILDWVGLISSGVAINNGLLNFFIITIATIVVFLIDIYLFDKIDNINSLYKADNALSILIGIAVLVVTVSCCIEYRRESCVSLSAQWLIYSFVVSFVTVKYSSKLRAVTLDAKISFWKNVITHFLPFLTTIFVNGFFFWLFVSELSSVNRLNKVWLNIFKMRLSFSKPLCSRLFFSTVCVMVMSIISILLCYWIDRLILEKCSSAVNRVVSIISEYFIVVVFYGTVIGAFLTPTISSNFNYIVFYGYLIIVGFVPSLLASRKLTNIS